ncbi:MAG: hypothetical protein FWE63_06705 [Bacteroidales bacterium]|nr:hypothetical protein [Bacteroidales bacterium]
MATEIVYLLGAGASYGTRTKDEKGNDIRGYIERGIPIVNELEDTIKILISELPQSKSKEARERVVELLQWLAEKCRDFPTIDTYAKLLYVTKQENEYKKLKNGLSLFFTLVQLGAYSKKVETMFPRDLRYDGFIASLISENRQLPNKMKILSWNYDCQFELAFGEYLKSISERYMENIWKELNVSDKLTASTIYDGFGIVKLNGSATTVYTHDNNYHNVDIFYPLMEENDDLITLCDRSFVTESNQYKNRLSFAWEQESIFFENIINQVKTAKTLVVIGYSFPYVNREIDKMIIQSMGGLQTICVQDVEPSIIRERINATLSDAQKGSKYGVTNIIEIKNLNQFVIPNEL